MNADNLSIICFSLISFVTCKIFKNVMIKHALTQTGKENSVLKIAHSLSVEFPRICNVPIWKFSLIDKYVLSSCSGNILVNRKFV